MAHGDRPLDHIGEPVMTGSPDRIRIEVADTGATLLIVKPSEEVGLDGPDKVLAGADKLLSGVCVAELLAGRQISERDAVNLVKRLRPSAIGQFTFGRGPQSSKVVADMLGLRHLTYCPCSLPICTTARL